MLDLLHAMLQFLFCEIEEKNFAEFFEINVGYVINSHINFS